MRTKSKKTFDCVRLKRDAQAEVYEEIKGKTPEEEIEYFRNAAQTGPLGDWWRRVKEVSRGRPGHG